MMQNHNVNPWPWGQGPPPRFQASQTVFSPSFSSNGLNQSPLVSGYHQIYGNSSVQSSDFTQWNSTHLQQWQQWQQWQEKYQQWHIQYGKKYAESLVATGQNSNMLLPGLEIFQAILKSEKSNSHETSSPVPVPAPSSNPPLPPNSLPPPPPPDEEKLPFSVTDQETKHSTYNFSIRKEGQEELSDAEKTFDVQFKEWEGQFNTWKKENQDHPDKVQYKEYEKKWEAWREQLLQRREQMRKKRLSQTPEKKIEQINSGNCEEKKVPLTGILQLKPPALEYGYLSHPFLSQGLASSDTKFENKQSLLKQSDDSFTNNHSALSSINFCSIPENMSCNKTTYGNGKKFIKIQGQGVKCYPKTQNQIINEDLGLGLRSENYGRKQRSRNEDVTTSRFRLGCESFEKEKNNANPIHQSSNNLGIEKEVGLFNFTKSETENVRGNSVPGSANCLSESNVSRNFSGNKPKVPSLFDITVEKPSGFGEFTFDRRHEIREKNCYFERKRNEREEERFQGGSGSKNFQFKTITSQQPWEEGIISNKVQERSYGNSNNGSNCVITTDHLRLEKQNELSGYVGNILAKLGQSNALENAERVTFRNDQNFQRSTEKNKQIQGSVKLNFIPEDSLDKDFYKSNSKSVLGKNIENEKDKSSSSKQDRINNENFRKSDESEISTVGGVGGVSFFESGEIYNERTVEESEKRKSDEETLVNEEQLSNKFALNTDNFKKFTKEVCLNPEKDFLFSNRNERSVFGRNVNCDSNMEKFSYRGQSDGRFISKKTERCKGSEKKEKNFFERKRTGRVNSLTRDRDFISGELVWKPQVFDYSQGRPLKITDPDEDFKISTVVDYSHGENMQTFEYKHGENRGSRSDSKFVGYGHCTDSPTVIDYGHGFENSVAISGFVNEESRENGKGMELKIKSISEESVLLNSRSRSPHLKFKRRSPSPCFNGERLKGKEVIGRQMMVMRRRKNVEEKYLGSSETEVSKPPFDVTTVLVEDLICQPGRETRPSKLVFIMRGIPGSGKTYVTKLIKDKEIESGGDPPRILSLDDYFMTEVEKEVRDKETGRKVKTKALEYEYEAGMESRYKGSLIKAFKKTISDGFFSFVIVDSINEKTKDYEEMWSFAKQKGFQRIDKSRDYQLRYSENRVETSPLDPRDWCLNPRDSMLFHLRKTSLTNSSEVKCSQESGSGFAIHYRKFKKVYVAEMDNDVVICTARNIHKRTERDILGLAKIWEETPSHYLRLDVRSLLQSDAITEVEMEVINDTELEKKVGKEGENDLLTNDEFEKTQEIKEEEDEDEPGASTLVKSRWDHFENSEQNLDRLDGLKRRREGFHETMEDYLQLSEDMGEIACDSASGKKRVRWADLEERRQQEMMRAIGFVVGQTDWNRMTDPTFGESALTRTKYI